jgi:hypothetical protein
MSFGVLSFSEEKRSNSIRKQTWFSWRINGIQSFIGWFPFLSFSIGWTVFITGPKKKKTVAHVLGTCANHLISQYVATIFECQKE